MRINLSIQFSLKSSKDTNKWRQIHRQADICAAICRKIGTLSRARVLKPWVATQNWVAAYFVVGQWNDNGSHGSPTDLQYIYIDI